MQAAAQERMGRKGLKPRVFRILYSPLLGAYEKVLLDCLLGDQILFWRQDGVESGWSFLTPILEVSETCGNRAERLLPYEAGSWGPSAVKNLCKDVRIRT